MNNKILFIIGFVLFTGCSTAWKQSYLHDNFEYSEAILNIKINSYSIIDQRNNTTSRELKIPAFSWPGSEDTIEPVLNEEHKELIRDQIFKHIGNKGQKYNVTVYIKKGNKSFNTSWGGEHEKVTFGLNIRLESSLGYQQASGEAWSDVKSIDASQEYTEQLYQKAIRDSIHRCFKSFKEQ